MVLRLDFGGTGELISAGGHSLVGTTKEVTTQSR